jgi:AhpD family alkylhydroperoxidase
MSEQNYPKHRQHIELLMKRMSKELVGPAAGFAELHHESLEEGALGRKVKELIALGIAIAARCDGGISCHIHDALRAGATRHEIVETIGVAMLMGGELATMYGCQAFEALQQFDTELAEELAEKRASQIG